MDPEAMQPLNTNNDDTTCEGGKNQQPGNTPQDLLDAMLDGLTMMEVAIRTMRQAIARARLRSEPGSPTDQ